MFEFADSCYGKLSCSDYLKNGIVSHYPTISSP